MGWTSEQAKAIASRKGNFLVSAGAGSGKTAVLTERIKQIVLEGLREKKENVPIEERKGASVTELLVLTFSNKAAAEMKSRIRFALFDAYRKGELDEDVSPLVESADITTFDSYFYSIVKKYHYELGLGEDVSIIDESYINLFGRGELDRLFAERYKSKEGRFLRLIGHFALKDDENVKDAVWELYLSALRMVDPLAYLASLKGAFYEEGFFHKLKADWMTYQKEWLAFHLENAAHIESKELFDFVTSALPTLEGLKGEDALHDLALSYEESPLPSFRSSPFKVLKEGEEKKSKYIYVEEDDFGLAKAILSSYKDGIESFKNIGTFEENIEKSIAKKPYIEEMAALAEELYRRIDRYKKEKNVHTFSDIALLSRQALAIPSIRKRIASSYKYVMVDEYQDTSDSQEAFLRQVSDNNLFAVGDIKQSIYRFRFANPSIFLEKFLAYKKGDGGTLITLNTNFRSAPNVIANVNDFFGEVLSERLGGLSFDDSQKSLFGNEKAYGPDKRRDFESERILYKDSRKEDLNAQEARLVAKDILSKVGRYTVYGKKGPHLAAFSDFVILSRTKSSFSSFIKVFSENKIPLAPSLEFDLSDEDVALLFKSFVRLFLTIGQDEREEKHCYLSIQRSYLYGLDDQSLFEGLRDGNYKQSDFYKGFLELRPLLLRSSPSEGVELLLEKYPFFEKLPTIGNVTDNYEKINSFRAEAKVAERLGMSFFDFATSLQEREKRKLTETVGLPPESEDAVRLMSIHVSKGLEFPLVYIVGNYKNLTTQSTPKGRISATKDYGLLLKGYKDEKTIASTLYKNIELKSSLDEEMRILYVAMTRAESKVIFVDREEESEGSRLLSLSFLRKSKKGKYSIASPKSFHDFFALSKSAFPSFPLLTPKEKEGGEEPKERKEETPLPAPSLRSINLDTSFLQKARASKNGNGALDYGKIGYGLRMHKLLELVSFKKKDISWMAEGEEKRKIAAILDHPFFSKTPFEREFHEYSFFDEENNLHGSIDLLLVNESVCFVIDYKSKDTDDPAYKRQLSFYRGYIERVFRKETKTYLLSIADASLTEIE